MSVVCAHRQGDQLTEVALVEQRRPPRDALDLAERRTARAAAEGDVESVAAYDIRFKVRDRFLIAGREIEP